jgi:MFS family permease
MLRFTARDALRTTLLLALLATPSSALVLSRRPMTGAAGPAPARRSAALPPELTPITLGVFSQMLGEGIAMSSLPLYLTRLGAAPLTVGVAISCFSIAQMTCAPLMVRLSSRVGRARVLRLCLAGAAASSLLIATAGGARGVVAGRALAGVFAACVPVAQSGVIDLMPRNQTALGLSRVSAASQLGIVVGPAASALIQAALGAAGLPAESRLPAVFVVAAGVSLGVLVQTAALERRGRRREAAGSALPSSSEQQRALAEEERRRVAGGGAPAAAAPPPPGALRHAQLMLSSITVCVTSPGPSRRPSPPTVTPSVPILSFI